MKSINRPGRPSIDPHDQPVSVHVTLACHAVRQVVCRRQARTVDRAGMDPPAAAPGDDGREP